MKGIKKMKKTLRLFTAVIFTVFMVMSMSITAFAVDEFSITVNRANSDKAAHTYEAYQIFSVTKISGNDKAVSGVEWGDGVNGTTLLDALKNDTTVVDTTKNTQMKTLFAGKTTAAGVAMVVDANKEKAAFVKRFAELVNNNLGTKAATETMAAGSTSVKLDVTEKGKGYYFVKDKDNSQDDTAGAYTSYILQVLGQVTIDAKEVVPTLDKKIVDGNNEVSENTASIGDTVKFRIKTAVPNTSAYNKYFFIIKDSLCNGLTFVSDSVKVYANNAAQALTADKYTVKITGIGTGETFNIVLKDAKTYSGQSIVVEYEAFLNKNADITMNGNPNTASLTYSNNPNHEYKGNDEPSTTPGDDDVMGKTPDVQTKTFTTGLKLVKVDGEDHNKKLQGAKFTISGNGVKAVMVNGKIYKEDDTGKFYMLKDGTFTENGALAADKYDDKSKRYALIDVVKKDTKDETINKTAYSNADGVITFVGLGEGTYTITEDEAPEGYNKVSPFEITIKAEYNKSTKAFEGWTVTKGTTELTADTDHLYKFEVENNQGIVLPDTGGVGTTIFYVVGGLMILCAGALLITKVRMGKKDK
jgi:fimbrial isopeptide formation D2 family protein/LPXTG-motif cell wall-anchored protein